MFRILVLFVLISGCNYRKDRLKKELDKQQSIFDNIVNMSVKTNEAILKKVNSNDTSTSALLSIYELQAHKADSVKKIIDSLNAEIKK